MELFTLIFKNGGNMNLIETIKNAGIVGAGGAGFPTHIKLNTKAEYHSNKNVIK